jgi:hypothetical protein
LQIVSELETQTLSNFYTTRLDKLKKEIPSLRARDIKDENAPIHPFLLSANRRTAIKLVKQMGMQFLAASVKMHGLGIRHACVFRYLVLLLVNFADGFLFWKGSLSELLTDVNVVFFSRYAAILRRITSSSMWMNSQRN